MDIFTTVTMDISSRFMNMILHRWGAWGLCNPGLTRACSCLLSVHEGICKSRTVTRRTICFQPTHVHTHRRTHSSHTSIMEGHSYFPHRRLAHLCLHFSPYTPVTIATRVLFCPAVWAFFQTFVLFVMCRNKTTLGWMWLKLWDLGIPELPPPFIVSERSSDVQFLLLWQDQTAACCSGLEPDASWQGYGANVCSARRLHGLSLSVWCLGPLQAQH